MESICIIPARGGSKRIPRKNVLPLNGVPLIAYTIRAAKNAHVFDKIIVSSEDTEIQKVAIDEGVDVDNRPEQMAGDKVTKVTVVREYLERTKAIENYEFVAALLPTCPFRHSDDIKIPYNKFISQKENDFLIGVVEYDFPVQLALEKASEDIMRMVNPDGYNTTRSQNIEKRYHPNGSLYLARIDAFLTKGTFFNEQMMVYEMPPERSWDIDYPWQWDIAEFMAKKIENDRYNR